MMTKDMKNFYVLFILSIIAYVVTYSLNVFLARHLPADLYGEYSLALRVLNFFVALALFGTNMETQRSLSKFLQLHKSATAMDYVAWNFKLISIAFLLIFTLAILSFLLMVVFHIYGIRQINQYHLSIYMLWITPIAALSSLMASYLMSCKQVVLASTILNLFPRLLQLVFFMVIVLFLNVHLDNMAILITIFLSFLLLSFLALCSMNKEILQMVFSGVRQLGKTRINTDWLRASLRLMGNHLIITLITLMDLTIVTIFVQNKAHVGYYAAILTITFSISFIPNAVYQTLKPDLSTLLSSSSGRIELQQRLNKLNFLNVFCIIALGTSIIFYSKTLLLHFGPAYLVAQVALIFRTVAACIEAICRMSIQILINAGLDRILLNFRFATLLLTLLCMIPATYYFDITGTSIASSIILLGLNGIFLVKLVRQKTGIKSLSIF